jgi:formylglycine-generating enzyme required for sulfatase activity
MFVFLLFVSAALAGTQGVFNGLVGAGDVGAGSAAEQQAFSAKNGFIAINSASTGRFTGMLRLEGRLDAFSGAWTSSNTASVTVVRAGKSQAVLELQHSGAVPGEVSGTVTVGGVALSFRALRCDYRPSEGSHALGGRRYSILLPPPAGLAMGVGVATLFVGADGLASLSGWLPNGQSFSTGARMVDDGLGHWMMPVYVAAAGVLTGELEIAQDAPATGSEVGGTLAWLKPAAGAGAAGGFLKEIFPVGTFHSALDSVLSTGLGGGAFTLTMKAGAGGLSGDAVQSGTWPGGGKPAWAGSGIRGLTMGFTAPNGQFSGAFTTVKKGAYKGLLLSREVQLKDGTQVRGAGFYSSGTGTGPVLVTSSAPAAERPANADLKGLVLSSGVLSPAFATGTLNYSASVISGLGAIKVTPTLSKAFAKVQIRANDGAYVAAVSGQESGTLALKIGANTLEVKVTAENGVTVKTYTVSVNVPPVLPGMVSVPGGTLPKSSYLSGEVVGDFQIGKYEVTWGEWKVVRDWAVGQGYSDLAGVGAGAGDNYPVAKVSWYDAVKWCNAKSEKEGYTPVYQLNGATLKTGTLAPSVDPAATGYRLPKDAEREWASRGGAQTHGYTYSGSNDLSAVGWTAENSGGAAHEVGKKAANELGLFDMSGNVFEWCWELVGSPDFRRISGGDFANLEIFARVNGGGGSWHAYERSSECGFRVVFSSGRWLSTNADLSGLRLSSGILSPAFASGTTNYAVNFGSYVSGLTVRSEVSQRRAKVEARMNGGAFTKLDSAGSQTLALQSGSNTLEVKVTAEDEVNVKTYTVNVSNASAASSAETSMVSVLGGVLPEASFYFRGQTVGDFQIGKTEVTFGQWKVVRDWAVAHGYTDLAGVGDGGGDNHPVRNVSWYDVLKWCNAKSEQEGKAPVYMAGGVTFKTGQTVPSVKASANGYRLPTEFEWEWAACGGRQTHGYTYSGSNDVYAVAWAEGYLYSAVTCAVGLKLENELALYDMSGNVSEWCWDLISGYETDYRPIRGGSLRGGTPTLFSRDNVRNPDYRDVAVGFRLACSSSL